MSKSHILLTGQSADCYLKFNIYRIKFDVKSILYIKFKGVASDILALAISRMSIIT